MYKFTGRLLAPALLVVLPLAGCGNKGPLKMPPATTQATAGSAEAPRVGLVAGVRNTSTPTGSNR